MEASKMGLRVVFFPLGADACSTWGCCLLEQSNLAVVRFK